MPKEGYKSVTIADDVYDLIEKIYQRKELAKFGIRSRASIMTYLTIKGFEGLQKSDGAFKNLKFRGTS